LVIEVKRTDCCQLFCSIRLTDKEAKGYPVSLV
jgi:hypothetical protein